MTSDGISALGRGWVGGWVGINVRCKHQIFQGVDIM